MRSNDKLATKQLSVANRKMAVEWVMRHFNDDVTRQYLAMVAMNTGIRPELLKDLKYRPTEFGICASATQGVGGGIDCFKCPPARSYSSRDEQADDSSPASSEESSRMRSLTTQWEDRDHVETLMSHLASLREQVKE